MATDPGYFYAFEVWLWLFLCFWGWSRVMLCCYVIWYEKIFRFCNICFILPVNIVLCDVVSSSRSCSIMLWVLTSSTCHRNLQPLDTKPCALTVDGLGSRRTACEWRGVRGEEVVCFMYCGVHREVELRLRPGLESCLRPSPLLTPFDPFTPPPPHSVPWLWFHFSRTGGERQKVHWEKPAPPAHLVFSFIKRSLQKAERGRCQRRHISARQIQMDCSAVYITKYSRVSLHTIVAIFRMKDAKVLMNLSVPPRVCQLRLESTIISHKVTEQLVFFDHLSYRWRHAVS
jgi:hypothetical protein